MSRIHIIADLHFGHENAIHFRTQFKTIQEHDETLIKNWNGCVMPQDTVIVLGDFSFRASQDYVDSCRKRLNGTIKLVRGNHDIITPKDVVVMPPLYSYKGFWLSHAPIHPLELRGKKNIHGHTHSFKIPDENYIPVSCEHTNYKPVLFNDLKRLITPEETNERMTNG